MVTQICARIVVTLMLLFANTVATAKDFPGSADHQDVPRIANSEIRGYAQSSYDEGVFQAAMRDKAMDLDTAEGARWRILYVLPVGVSPLQALRNYQSALEELGDIEMKFTCRKDCFRNLGGSFVWADGQQIPQDLIDDPSYLYWTTDYYNDQVYWYATVTGDKRYTVSIYATVSTPSNTFIDRTKVAAGQTLLHFELIEDKAFEPTLEVVEAQTIANEIAEQGHIALHGIFFDTDQTQPLPKSRASLAEIATALQADEALSLYVVGHTDNIGDMNYNQVLSEKRARAVVQVLTDEHNIAPGRLIPVGVGLAAPMATNDTEHGRAQNRRVELVKR